MRRTFVSVLIFLCAMSAFAVDLPTKKVSVGPIDLTLGFDKGLALTASGEHVSTIGSISDTDKFAPGYTLNIDAVANTSAKKADNATLAGGIGWVSVDPGSFFPRLAGFIQMQAKTGQAENDANSHFDRVNQIVAGATVEYVPTLFIDFIMQGHRLKETLPMVLAHCDKLTDAARLEDHTCVRADLELRCAAIGDDAKNDPACKKLLDDAEKTHGAIEAPPLFVLGYFHPLRTSGGDIGDLPDAIEADKITFAFEADNHLPRVRLYRDRTLHVTANLSATYPTTGSDRKITGKIDVGFGVDVTKTFTPIIKYVSGKKDGFTYDKSVILGVLIDLSKLKLP
jgi:hypothetical protein